MPQSDATILALDWSGARGAAQRRGIALAGAADGRLVRLERDLTREAAVRRLCDLADRTPRLVVGIDFAFSLPRWFLDARGLTSAPALWALVARDGERWLADCAPPFWGRPGRRRPDGDEPWRRTERRLAARTGLRPSSVFQIGGAGSVGTASLRGMPCLTTLRAAGFRVWPFDPPGYPLAVEIWPRLAIGRAVKRDPAARAACLTTLAAAPGPLAADAARDEHAFDAAAAALAMDAARPHLAALPPARDATDALEGRIWGDEEEPEPGTRDAGPGNGRR